MMVVCRSVFVMAFVAVIAAEWVSAQTINPAQPGVMETPGWQFMQDGVVFAEFNHQGSSRGGNELVASNWWMGMANWSNPRSRLTFTAMFSLDPATNGKNGYREIFQAGEVLDGRPLVDRQHPHDLFMQLAAVWRVPIGASTGFTFAGAPAGEPALGPIAFLHRASAGDNPTAPLGHHTFDSTHVSFGVLTAAIDRGRWLVEGSLFNGREPDDERWDVDFGRLDSMSGRVWFRPTAEWELQTSFGYLRDPEVLEPGDIKRSTASLGWTRMSGTDVRALTAGFGRNDTHHGARQAFFLEGARQVGSHAFYGRFETVQIEASGDGGPVHALTLGGARRVLTGRHVEGRIGADITVHRTPDTLRSVYGSHPVSAHLFVQLRPSGAGTGRMWNMRMSQPMSGHIMTHQMAQPGAASQ
jgi:hypothetical protein